MRRASTTRRAPDVAAGPAPIDLAVVGADAVSIRRVDAILSAAGLAATVRVAEESSAAPADVLVLWSSRGITARDALLGRLRSRLPGTRLVVVGPCDSPASIRAAIEAGADGMVFEREVDRALPATILAALAGQIAVPAVHRHGVGAPNLTAREKQVIGMVVLGLSNKEIGARLFLADSTVKSHLSSVFGKLGVRSRNEAVSMILDPEQKLGLGILGISDTARRTVEVAS
jgi:DNA-binding NarL/FixJ family response regulator